MGGLVASSLPSTASLHLKVKDTNVSNLFSPNGKVGQNRECCRCKNEDRYVRNHEQYTKSYAAPNLTRSCSFSGSVPLFCHREQELREGSNNETPLYYFKFEENMNDVSCGAATNDNRGLSSKPVHLYGAVTSPSLPTIIPDKTDIVDEIIRTFNLYH